MSNSSTPQIRRSALASRQAGTVSLFLMLLNAARRILATHRAARELSNLDERMLKDIGLMRGDDGQWRRDQCGTAYPGTRSRPRP